MKNAVIGTSNYHAVMQQAAKHALQKQGGYIAPVMLDKVACYPHLDIKLEHLHHMVCGVQFPIDSQQLIAQNPRITYLLLIETLLIGKDDEYEQGLQKVRMRLIALLVDICITGQVDKIALDELLGYTIHLSTQTPAHGSPSNLLGRPIHYEGQKAQQFTEYCLAILETLNDAQDESMSYRVRFLKYWRDLSHRIIYERGWLSIETSMNWLREQVITRLESPSPKTLRP